MNHQVAVFARVLLAGASVVPLSCNSNMGTPTDAGVGSGGGGMATGGGSGLGTVGGDSSLAGTIGVAGGSGISGGASGATAGALGGAAGSGTDGAAFYDPVSTDHITTAFALVRAYAATTLAAPEVRFISVRGVPTGPPGTTYDTTPLRWTYQFSACDASVQPCTNTQIFELTQPGMVVVGPIVGTAAGLSLLETEFQAAVPLDFTQLLANSAPNQQFCPIGPTPQGTEYVSLQGGTKSGSGRPLWYWTFECANAVNGTPVYRNSNGDPIT